jgi:hypothetical protein
MFFEAFSRVMLSAYAGSTEPATLKGAGGKQRRGAGSGPED